MVITEAYEGELLYLEHTLETDIMFRNLNYDLDRMTSFYYEDGEGEETAENQGLLDKIANAIVAICEKIRKVIFAFKNKLSGIGKESITGKDYVNSSRGQAELNKRFMEVQKEIDEYYRQNRPIIAAISNITGCDIEDVEKKCDMLNTFIEKVHWMDVAGVVIKEKAKRDKWMSYSDDALGWIDRAKKATEDIKGNKKKVKDKTKTLRVLQKYLNAQNKFTAKLFAQNSK